MHYGDGLRDRLRLDRIGPKVGHELRARLAPFVAPRSRLRDKRFALWGQSYRYLSHPFNTTYRNERAVEVPVVAEFLSGRNGRGMEFGNVLAHYGLGGGREVVDKYERAAGVTNLDVLDYAPDAPLDYIVSISTLEHVGWDEQPREPNKAIAALDHLLTLLAHDGRLLLTAPLGHNPQLDAAVVSGRWRPTRQATLVRVGDRRRNEWAERQELEVRPYFGHGGRGADSVWVAEFAAPTD